MNDEEFERWLLRLYKILILFVLLLVFLGVFLISRDAGAEMKVGLDWTYGRDFVVPEAWTCENSEATVNRLSLRIEDDWLLPERWDWQLELHYSTHKFDEIGGGQDASMKELGINLALKRELFDDLFYVGFFAGLSVPLDLPEFEGRDWSDGEMHARVGNSGLLGSWGPLVGKDWQLQGKWSLRTELRFAHTSDPFRHDGGKNYGQMVVGLTYSF